MVNTMTNVDAMKIPEGYKLTEVGVVPEEWEVTTIDDVVKRGWLDKPLDGNHGDIHPKSGDFVSAGIPFVMANNVQNGKVDVTNCSFIKKSQADSLQKGFSRTGDVLLTHKATIGNTAVVGELDCEYIMLTPQVTYYRVLDNRILYNHYLRHYMDGYTFQSILESASGGGTRSYIGITAQRKLPIILPPIAEQKAIAKPLSDVDSLIAALETLIAKKSAIKTAAMQQLLTGKKRLPGFEGKSEGKSEKESAGASGKMADNSGEIQAAKPISEIETPSNYNSDAANTNNQQTAPRPGYKHTELGEIPEDWEVRTIESISAVPMQNGLFYEPSRKGKGVSLINVGDLYKAAPIAIEELELFDASQSEVSTFRVTNGDLFFTRSSMVPSGIAYCNIYDTSDYERNVVFDSHLIRVRVDALIADAKYVYLACISNLARKFLISSAKTATMTTIDQGAIKQCPVLLPPKKEQTAIANLLFDMDTELDALQQRLSKTQKIKQGMMQELLTGKTRLV